MKNLLVLVLILLTSMNLHAQNWSKGSSGSIYYNGGNVGIGTSNPVAKLQVEDNGTIGAKWNPSNSYLTLSGDGQYLIMDTNEIYSSTTMAIGAKSGSIIFRTLIGESGVADRMVITNTGNVGIGTGVPNATLQIGESTNQGRPSSETEIKRLSIAPVTHSGSDWFFTSRDNGYANLDIGYSTNKSLTLRHDGNVGIGTTTPDSKLAVNENIRAKEIKLETANWPDYVFDTDYQPMTLEETKDFIAAHGHLPGLKSAAEYEREGVNMMELNQKLLEKIEELTMNAIDQERAMKDKSAKIAEIESRMIQMEKILKSLIEQE